MAWLSSCDVNTISPVYVPTARVGGAVTITLIVSGVVHRTQLFQEVLSIFSQSPPFAVVAKDVKLKLVPVLASVRVCGSGLFPLNDLVKLIAFTWRKAASPTTTLTGTVALPLA